MTKTALAKQRQVARSTLYYKPKLPVKDEQLKSEIFKVWSEFPAYGHRRLSICLQVNRKRILRVMKHFKLKVPRRKGKKPRKIDDLKLPSVSVPNLLKDTSGNPITILCPDHAWAQDFTYLWFGGQWWYVATVIDLFTREILGFAFSKHHNKQLILDALHDALGTARKPKILHSDQGSEYQAYDYTDLLKIHNILLSYSKKASPWQNSYQESFYSNFKLDLGYTNEFDSLGHLIEAVYTTIHTYNHRRIHTALKMSPKAYYNQYILTKAQALKTEEKVS